VQSVVRFLLVGHGGFYNRGCEAIVRCTTELIRRAVPNSSIMLTSLDPEVDRAKVKEEGIPIDQVIPWQPKGTSRFSPTWAWQRLHRKVFYGDVTIQDYRHLRHYRRADVVLSVGGDNFTDDYGSPRKYFETLSVARRCGAKTVIWGASIGPFKPPEAEKTWAEYLKSIDLITVREDRTVKYLADLGVSSNVQRVCDPAFLLPAVPPRIPVPLDASHGMRVGIGMSDLMHKYGTSERYLDAFARLIEHIATAYGGEIVLVPHVIQGKDAQNDFAVCQEMAGRVDRTCPCIVLPMTLNACELKYCISKCDYFVGARTHSTIASLSSLVPTISIGYSTKAWGINQDLLGCDDYVVDVQSISAKVLVERFERLRQEREHIVQSLRVSVPRARKNAERAGEYLLSLVNGASGCRR
jgi:colanic acid/amylovoran biosynthesis protein